jgi:hypothetical protein
MSKNDTCASGLKKVGTKAQYFVKERDGILLKAFETGNTQSL